MDQDQAERALKIIRGVIENTRDDLIQRNWGFIWMVVAFIDLAASVSGGFIQSSRVSVFWYMVPLTIAAALNMIVVRLFSHHDQGVRSYVEWQMWGIWLSILAATGLTLLVIHISKADAFLFGLFFTINTGIGFAMMGLVFYRGFLAIALLFFAVTLIGASRPDYQWWLIGGAWWLAMFVPGFCANREYRRRNEDGHTVRIL